ncbi:hypothetical protein [Nitrosomonas sp. Nm34]|uniref:hypothetical protein n=1 Tax=Nitrosomonas sp. Nm34 TaxID=1881055 RepID=UPI0008EC9876|nr:hypothetical protein [Nitrosomonas sp. Nm34]SFI60993.1 hypothetical protein SAMN05428978_10204 [Nitrosomonas sp. Nm34]
MLAGAQHGVPSDESVAYKDALSVPHSLRPKHEPPPKNNEPLPRMIFDMVRYKHPIGWQIENWRFINDESEETVRYFKVDGTNRQLIKL